MSEVRQATSEYRTHHYVFTYNRDDALFCLFCGKQDVWVEASEGDYYCGPDHVCAACGKSFTSPTSGDASEIARQLRAGVADEPRSPRGH